MGMFRSHLLLALCLRPRLAYSGTLLQDSEISCASGSAHCPGLKSDHVLLQVANQATVQRSALCTTAAGAGKALRDGLQATREALNRFAQDPPDVDGGFQLLGNRLLQAVQFLVSERVRHSVQYSDFVGSWYALVHTFPSDAKIAADLAQFAEDGGNHMLFDIFEVCLGNFSDVAREKLPKDVGFKISKYFASLDDALEGASEGLGYVSDGDQVAGVQSIYSGVQSAVDGLLPEDMRTDGTYAEVVNETQSELGSITEEFLKFARRVIRSKVCWRRSTRRERSHPAYCEDGYRQVGNQWCWPRGRAGRVRVARCMTGYQRFGSWCYGECSPGFQPFNQHCKQICGGRYRVDSPLMCGTTEGSISFAITKIVAKTAFAAVTQSDLAKVVVGAGYAVASSMTSVVHAMAEFAEPFGHTLCPHVANNSGPLS